MAESEPGSDYLQRHVERLCVMIARVDSLINLHLFLAPIVSANTSDRPPDSDDVLRAAVVLLHAHMEDSLRSIAREHLPRGNATLLKHIPLPGMENAKYTLGDLVAHSGKSINALIDESIGESLRKRSFNHCDDLSKLLRELGIDPSYCSPCFPKLAEMIARRHRIVHECDHAPNCGHPPTVMPIDRDTVEQWKEVVRDFLQRVLHKLQFVVEGIEEPKT